jgi:Ca2+-transporting ATPase
MRILFQGALVGGAALTAFAVLYDGSPESLPWARTMAFCVLVYGELLRALAARSPRLTLLELGLFTNPHLLAAIGVSALLQLSVVTMPFARSVFESVEHFAGEWFLLIGLALTPLIVMELAKLLRGFLMSPP